MLFIPDFSREIAPFKDGLIYAQLPFPANAQDILLYWIRKQPKEWSGADSFQRRYNHEWTPRQNHGLR